MNHDFKFADIVIANDKGIHPNGPIWVVAGVEVLRGDDIGLRLQLLLPDGQVALSGTDSWTTSANSVTRAGLTAPLDEPSAALLFTSHGQEVT